MTSPRCIRIVHALDGRIRFRLPWLRAAADDATTIADHLSGLNGMAEVQVRPYTGSVLCRYDPSALDRDAILQALKSRTGVVHVLLPGDAAPPTRDAPAQTSVAQAVRRSVGALDRDLQRATNGRLDLGTAAALGFFTLGAAEIAFTRKLPIPPWFNLAWWAVRTFTMFERDEAPASNALRPHPSRRQNVRRRRRLARAS
jgi:hypothetical protein